MKAMFCLFLVLAVPVCANEFLVHPSEGLGGIQGAINSAVPGDEIILAPGVYTSDILTSVHLGGTSVTLRSQDPNDPNIVAATILLCPADANGSVPAIVLEESEDGSTVLAGLTLTGGLTEPAILSEAVEAGFALQSCVIRDNQGGGLKLYNRVVLTDCLFYDNEGTYGGAIECRGGMVTLTRCIFRNNQAEYGGAIYGVWGIVCDRCQWVGNQARVGGGINTSGWLDCENCVWTCNVASGSGGALSVGHNIGLRNCTLAGNVAGSSGGAIFASDFITLESTIIAYNQDADGIGRSIKDRRGHKYLSEYMDVSYCCLQLDPGEETSPFIDSDGTIVKDPCFIHVPNDGGDGWGDDPATNAVDEGLNDDYGDLRLAADSPCIDAGSPICAMRPMGGDVNGLPRLMGATIDMGAYEFYQPTLEVTRPQGSEVWAAGSRQTLSWKQIEANTPVDILFSSDSGTQWQPLATAVDNTGFYAWQLPSDLDAADVLLRVTPSVALEHQYIADSAAFTVTPMTAGCPTDSPWSTLAGNVQRTGLSELTGSVDLHPIWDVNIPGEVFVSATLGCDNHIHLVSQRGVLYTLDSEGKLLWSVDVNVPLLTTPTVDPKGRVYVGDMNGRFYAFDDQSGWLWTWEAEGFICASAAVSAEGAIYVASEDGALVSLTEDGTLRWSFKVPSDHSLGDVVLASPAVGPDGTVYVAGYFDASLYALNPEDGSLRWTCVCADANATLRSQRGQLYAAPVVGDANVIYQALVSDPSLYAIDVQTGTVLWTLDCSASLTSTAEVWVSDSVWSEPALGPDGTLYVAMDDPYLRAVTPDGTLKWTVQLGQTGGFTLTVSPDGLIYAAGDDGTLYVVNAEGQVVTQLEEGGSLCYPVVTPEGLLLVTDVEHGLRAYGDSL